ncbi:MAG: class I SAM-dependent methyltransferase [Myxococcota bacterium]
MPRRRAKPVLTAATADKYDLYQRSVQDADLDVDFLFMVYQRIHRRRPRHLREDFCGTALIAANWVARGERYTAEGFDIDPEPLAWGIEHNLAPLGAAAERVVLHRRDVRDPGQKPADVRCAMNFSYQVFHNRADMGSYFRHVHDTLAKRGIFVMDMHGGWQATEDQSEERELSGFTYVWHQRSYQPVTARHDCAIHFRFPDDSWLRDAFVYDWRHWTMVELVELLREAGFHRIDPYFEEFDEDGDGNGEFAKSRTGPSCPSWLAYLVAVK